VFEGTAPDTSQTQGLPEGSGAIATMAITFPGKVTEHNGTLKGTTVTWDLLTLTEAPKATGSAIGGGSSLPVAVIIIACAAFLALVIVIVGIVLLTRRKGGSPKDDTRPEDQAPGAVEPAA
jgi:hypothetical protein